MTTTGPRVYRGLNRREHAGWIMGLTPMQALTCLVLAVPVLMAWAVLRLGEQSDPQVDPAQPVRLGLNGELVRIGDAPDHLQRPPSIGPLSASAPTTPPARPRPRTR